MELANMYNTNNKEYNSMKFLKILFAGLILTLCGHSVYAMSIISPGDSILGGQSNGTNFLIGIEGFDQDVNNWPGAESPDHLIDGVGQKYLNFGKLNTGAIITPSLGSSIVDSIQFWTANDVEPRDPTSYELWGTNDAISGTSIPFSIFSAISTGSLALPSSRNRGGVSSLRARKSQTVAFENFSAYSSYLVLLPTVKRAARANSMQLAEVQLFGESASVPASVPAPATLILFGLGLVGLVWSRRKKA